MQQWKTGDVVVLKSGSRAMTVSEILDDGDVCVQWIEPGGEVKHGCFKPAMLQSPDELSEKRRPPILSR